MIPREPSVRDITEQGLLATFDPTFVASEFWICSCGEKSYAATEYVPLRFGFCRVCGQSALIVLEPS